MRGKELERLMNEAVDGLRMLRAPRGVSGAIKSKEAKKKVDQDLIQDKMRMKMMVMDAATASHGKVLRHCGG
ncbi:hypothetical protein ACJ73_08176 [Blastomyces percursus]|uniref:Uncharacterized protein n=1 Tax=Blastomyces percursus TaxID=1658174 RepID=A0A1J9PX54_9EURO|nr:hypothetical protein ACJ73_08176 [Blastomyces percursus]